MRIRFKARFFVFLLILLAIVFLIVRPYLRFGVQQTTVVPAQAAYTQHANAIFVRDETTMSSGATARVEYIAAEGTLVQPGDTVAYLYSAGYTENELKKLEDLRASIQAYHKAILANIVDTQLNRLDEAVDSRAMEFKALVNHETSGNLNSLTRQLEATMVARQEYMRQNKREDLKLNKLYEDENTRLNSIASWRTVASADRGGVVSFYLDGYEDVLTVDKLTEITPDIVRSVLNGTSLATERSRTQPVYRIVDQDKWYAVSLTDARSWNPAVGQSYYFQVEGFEDVSYSATVSRVVKVSNEVLAEFEIDDPVGPMLYQRRGRLAFSTEFSGMSVSAKALVEQNGQAGVWVNDVPGGTFVAVNIISNDGKNALVTPVVDGALQIGQVLLIK